MLKDALKESGNIFLPKSVTTFLYKYIVGNNISIFYINYWSIMHLLSGVVFGMIVPSRWSYFWSGLLVHTLWELWQKFIGMTKWDVRGAIDTLMDFVMFELGMGMVAVIH